MKLKRLTKEKSNGTVYLVKKDIDFDMLSPVIAKVLTEAVEQLATLERKAVNDELLEVPYPIGTKINLLIEGRLTVVEIIGYELTKKDMILFLETKEGINIRMPYREAVNKLKKLGSVNVT